MTRTKPLSRLTPLRRTKRIPAVSKKRKEQNAEYAKLREEFLWHHPQCQVCLQEKVKDVQVIVQPSTQVHHANRRSGKLLLDTRFFVAVCAPHHDKIERHGDWARENGWLVTPEERSKIA